MMRPSFIHWTMQRRPSFGGPTSQPRQSFASPSASATDGSPLQPISWRTPLSWTSFGSSPPPIAGRRRGTTKSEMPLVPGGAPSMRARTKRTTFSVAS